MERIKTNVDKEIADKIRAYELDGVMVDEDFSTSDLKAPFFLLLSLMLYRIVLHMLLGKYRLSLDVVVQSYAEQAAKRALEAKGANSVSLIVMNPKNGEIYNALNSKSSGRILCLSGLSPQDKS